MMVSLAGFPAMIPSLVSEKQLNTANALEILSYTVSGIGGPALAGLLIALIGAPATVLVDVASYFIFASRIAGVQLSAPVDRRRRPRSARARRAAVRLLLGNPVLCSITACSSSSTWGWAGCSSGCRSMFRPGSAAARLSMAYCCRRQRWANRQARSVSAPRRQTAALGVKIIDRADCSPDCRWRSSPWCPDWRQCCGRPVSVGFFDSPLTIWAQTLRMAIIPPELRGRVFALIRLSIQGSGPVGSALAGFLLPVLGMTTMIMLSSAAPSACRGLPAWRSARCAAPRGRLRAPGTGLKRGGWFAGPAG